MNHLFRNVVLSIVFICTPVLAEQSEPAQSSHATEPSSKAEYIAEFERMGGECEAKLNKGTGADRMWRVCVGVCNKAAQDLRDWQRDPQQALVYAKKRMVKCGNNYKAGVDYEKRVKH